MPDDPTTRAEFLARYDRAWPEAGMARDLDALLAQARREALEEAAGVAEGVIARNEVLDPNDPYCRVAATVTELVAKGVAVAIRALAGQGSPSTNSEQSSIRLVGSGTVPDDAARREAFDFASGLIDAEIAKVAQREKAAVGEARTRLDAQRRALEALQREFCRRAGNPPPSRAALVAALERATRDHPHPWAPTVNEPPCGVQCRFCRMTGADLSAGGAASITHAPDCPCAVLARAKDEDHA